MFNYVFARAAVHSSHVWKLGYIFSCHFIMIWVYLHTKQETGESSLMLTQHEAPLSSSKNTLGKTAAFTWGAHIKLSVLVSNRNNNIRPYNANMFWWAPDYQTPKKTPKKPKKDPKLFTTLVLNATQLINYIFLGQRCFYSYISKKFRAN